MKNIDEIYKIVEESSHETAFNRGEVEELYRLLNTLDEKSNVVEIGVEYGRSTTVIAEVQKEKKYHFTAVDNFSQADGPIYFKHLIDQAQKYRWEIFLQNMDSVKAAKDYDLAIDLIHIDGDHTYEGVAADCKAWLPKVKTDGYALFDDYGHPGLEGVKKAVDLYMELFGEDWIYLDTYGEKLGVFKKYG